MLRYSFHETGSGASRCYDSFKVCKAMAKRYVKSLFRKGFVIDEVFVEIKEYDSSPCLSARSRSRVVDSFYLDYYGQF